MPKIDIATVPARKGSGYPPHSMRPAPPERAADWAMRAGCATSASI